MQSSAQAAAPASPNDGSFKSLMSMNTVDRRQQFELSRDARSYAADYIKYRYESALHSSFEAYRLLKARSTSCRPLNTAACLPRVWRSVTGTRPTQWTEPYSTAASRRLSS